MDIFENSGIYLIKNLLNNDVYIGSAINYKRRFRQHRHLLNQNKHHSNHLQRAYNKYGKENFKFEFILCCPKEDLIKIEQFFLNLYKPRYNVSLTADSRLGIKASEETRKKLSESHKGKASRKKGYKTGKPAWNRGISASNESKLKMSIAHKGKRHSSKTEFKKGQIYNNNLRKIECIDLGICFLSISDAARFCGNVNYQFNISACANGKQKTAYGHIWKFIN